MEAAVAIFKLVLNSLPEITGFVLAAIAIYKAFKYRGEANTSGSVNDLLIDGIQDLTVKGGMLRNRLKREEAKLPPEVKDALWKKINQVRLKKGRYLRGEGTN